MRLPSLFRGLFSAFSSNDAGVDSFTRSIERVEHTVRSVKVLRALAAGEVSLVEAYFDLREGPGEAAAGPEPDEDLEDEDLEDLDGA